MINRFLCDKKTPVGAALLFLRTVVPLTTVKSGNSLSLIWVLTSVCGCWRVCGFCVRCPATPCGVALRWLTAPVRLYNSWSLLCVWLYKHRVGWLPHAELQYWSLRRDPTAALIVFCPFLSCQSIALCVDFYPLTNHSAPLPLLSCQSSGRYCLIWSPFSSEFHIPSGKSTISTK